MSTRKKGWGEFNSILEKNEGYDMIVMLSHMKEDAEILSHYEWLKKALRKVKEITKVKISSIGRPLCKVSITPSQVLDLVKSL
jgi:hypothetical protein